MRQVIKQQTLFNVENPEEHARPEYYELAMVARQMDGQLQYAVCEYHGFWDDKSSKPVQNNPTLEPDRDGYTPSREEADVRYQQQQDLRVKNGFEWALSLLDGTRTRLTL